MLTMIDLRAVRRVAEEGLAEDRKEAALIDLPNTCTDVVEALDVRWHFWRSLTVEVGDSEDVEVAALWSTRRAEPDLTAEDSRRG